MCQECHQSPCHPRCPNAPEPKAVFICSGRGEEIFEGDDYWDILGEQFCEECIKNAKTEAEQNGFVCVNCGHEICEGEDYWNIMDRPFCEECIDKAKGEAVHYDDGY